MAQPTDSKQYKEAERKLEIFIAKNGLRHTLERYTILRHACNLGNPFTAGQLIERAAADNISKPTVYNTLRLLQTAQIIFNLGNRGLNAQYEVVTGGKIRMQLRCGTCGRTAALRDAVISDVVMGRKFNNFNISHFSLYVYGTCKVCKRLQGKRRPMNTSRGTVIDE